jgi:4-hydroxyacetophenone monooxygenase
MAGDIQAALGTASDETIRAALADADLPPLLPALACLTGNLLLLHDDLRPDTGLLAEEGGYTEEQRQEIRRLAFTELTRYRDAGCPPAGSPAGEELGRVVDFVSGNRSEEFRRFLIAQLALEDHDAPGWHRDELAPGKDMTVAVIGAGMSGLLAAYRLRQAGVDVVVLEKNDEVGGTWLENGYPGCRVDVANHLYCYSFAQKPDWPEFYSPREVLLTYFRDFAADAGIRGGIRFGTEVVSAEYDDRHGEWALRLRTADGQQSTLRVNAVISAVGQLNRPRLPAIEGLGTFAGPAFHSAQWDRSVDLTGKRIAVIGTGASSFQIVPEIAGRAGEVWVFQRTPPWLVPTPNYTDPIGDGMLWLLRNVPGYAQWYRFWLFCQLVEGIVAAIEVDPEWTSDDGSVSAANAELRAMIVEGLRAQLPDDPELLDKVVPGYPLGGKRGLRDNGTWIATLKREDVHLVTEEIERITEHGVVTAEAGERRFDVLIYATGFQASNFLTPMTVKGRGGTDLHEQWDGDARAYLGMTVPGFPNLFLLYGPNTNIVANGSIIFFSECSVHYVLECIGLLLANGHRVMECRKDVHDEFNQRVDEHNARMAWGIPGVASWYKNQRGRVSANWPFPLFDYWNLTRSPAADDFEFS